MRHERFLYCFNDKQHFRRFLIGLAVLAFFTGIGAVFIPQAWALGAYCTGATAAANQNMFSQDTLTNTIDNNAGGSYTIAATDLNTETEVQTNFTNSCPQQLGVSGQLGIAGQVICLFKSSIGQIVTTMYCSFQDKLTGVGSPLPIALELFIVIFGIAVMTGMVNFTVREGMVAILKIALVWTFAANSDWGLGIAYNFFIGFAEEGSNIVLGAAAPGSGGGQLLTQSDSVIQNVFNLISTGTVATNMPTSLTGTCGLMLFSMLVLLIVFLPMIAGFIVVMILQYLMLYVRAILGYLTALVLISFLFILSPLFISFALFKVTRPMFEQWLKYLTSYSLQMIIVFSFLAMLSLIPIGAFFYEILSLLRQVNTTEQGNMSIFTSSTCSVCSYVINATANIGDTPAPITCDATTNVIPLSKLVMDQNLVQALLAQIVALWIIGIVMQDFLKRAPSFANELTGRLPNASLLGGAINGAGFASTANAALDYLGLDELDKGIESLGQKISDLGDGRNKVWNRIAPAAGVAALGMLASTMFAKKSPDGSGSQATTTASGGKRNSAGLLVSDTSAKNSLAGTVLRNAPAVNDIRTMPGGSDTDRLTYQQADEVMDNNYAEVTQALQDVEASTAMIGTDPTSIFASLQKLQYASDAYEAASTTFYESQQALLRDRLGLQGGTVSTAERGALLKSQASAPNLTVAQMNNLVDKAVKYLELQIKVKPYLSPGASTSYAQDGLQSAVDDRFKGGNTKENLQNVLKQLYKVEQSLVGGISVFATGAVAGPAAAAASEPVKRPDIIKAPAPAKATGTSYSNRSDGLEFAPDIAMAPANVPYTDRSDGPVALPVTPTFAPIMVSDIALASFNDQGSLTQITGDSITPAAISNYPVLQYAVDNNLPIYVSTTTTGSSPADLMQTESGQQFVLLSGFQNWSGDATAQADAFAQTIATASPIANVAAPTTATLFSASPIANITAPAAATILTASPIATQQDSGAGGAASTQDRGHGMQAHLTGSANQQDSGLGATSAQDRDQGIHSKLTGVADRQDPGAGGAASAQDRDHSIHSKLTGVADRQDPGAGGAASAQDRDHSIHSKLTGKSDEQDPGIGATSAGHVWSDMQAPAAVEDIVYPHAQESRGHGEAGLGSMKQSWSDPNDIWKEKPAEQSQDSAPVVTSDEKSDGPDFQTDDAPHRHHDDEKKKEEQEEENIKKTDRAKQEQEEEEKKKKREEEEERAKAVKKPDVL